MKIVITGAHGTGKSTLAKRLAEELNLELLSEAAYEAYEAGFSLNENTSFEAEEWILKRQMEKEAGAKGGWVSDRCLIDTLAYTNYFFPQEREKFEAMLALATPNIWAYDLVIYLPAAQFPLENDGLRSTNEDFQKAVDAKIRELMDEQHIQYMELTGSVEERVGKVKGALSVV